MKQIIILERQDGSPTTYRVAFWFAVPAARQAYFARTGAVSTWKGASTAENAAIAAGQVVEAIDSAIQQDGASDAQVAADLQARWTQKNADFQASLQLFRYGSFWDGTAWTVVTA